MPLPLVIENDDALGNCKLALTRSTTGFRLRVIDDANEDDATFEFPDSRALRDLAHSLLEASGLLETALGQPFVPPNQR